MKSADLRDRDDAHASLEGLMRAGGVVYARYPRKQASEVPFVEHNDVIEALPSNRPDDMLSKGILER